MGSKKISFGFNKSIKKPSVFTANEEEKNDVQLIDFLEEQSIKVIGEKVETNTPLVIPLRDDAKNLLDKVREMRSKERVMLEDNRPDSELTLDELAARQLLQEAKTQTIQNGTKIYSVPLSADQLPLNGEKEPTLEDYENIPISDFGLAMLRGMGWKDGMNIGKNQEMNLKVKEPELRPKGLGLGAAKMVKETKPKVAVDKEGKELRLTKGACAKIMDGVHKGKYGEVQGFDESSRIIIKTTISQEVLSVIEYWVIPVTKEEYEKCSKILNLNTYQEYKSKNDIQNTSNQRANSSREHSSFQRKKSKKHRSRSRSPQRSKSSKSKHRSRESSSDDKGRRYERSESSESDRVKYKKKSKKSKKDRRNDSSCDSESNESDRVKYKKKSKKSKKDRRDVSSCDSESNDSDRVKHKKKSKKSKKDRRNDSSGDSGRSRKHKKSSSRRHDGSESSLEEDKYRRR